MAQKKSAFFRFRLLFLVYVLLFVALGAWLDHSRTTSWERTLWVGIYPVNGDNSEKTSRFISQLRQDDFFDIREFFQREAARYELGLQTPVDIELGQPVPEHPPKPPVDGNVFKVMTWSLKLRYWAWRRQGLQPGPLPDIRMYVVFYDPEQHPVLSHSLGLEKGLLGVVNAFASRSQMGSNNVVLAHELMHTLGARDRYDRASNLPLFPAGYAEPERQPLHPQTRAEIMGGRIPLAANEAVTPRSLSNAIIGPVSATEIYWIN
ncbi:MAG: hypothetical protein KJO35_03615 [Gammaproteobacteria bacterium]|nr:hypothetical protein [Gammaproteobacteria bacterium]